MGHALHVPFVVFISIFKELVTSPKRTKEQQCNFKCNFQSKHSQLGDTDERMYSSTPKTNKGSVKLLQSAQ